METLHPALISAVIVVVLALMFSAYTVDQRQAAIKFRLGEIVSMQTDPVCTSKLPLIENIRHYDTRIQTIDAKDPRANPDHRKGKRAGRFVRQIPHRRRQNSFWFHARRRQRGRDSAFAAINNDLRDEFSKRSLSPT